MALVRAGAASRIAVTLGPEGAFLVTGDGAVHMPAVAGPVLSAVGAGDAFLAAMVLSLSPGGAGSGCPGLGHCRGRRRRCVPGYRADRA